MARRALLLASTGYALLWCCLAPVLAYCTCDDAATAYSYRGHAERGCHAHESCVPDAPRPWDREHDGDDAPVPSDQFVSSAAKLVPIAPAAVGARALDAAGSGLDATPAFRPGPRPTGPPDAVRASLASVVLRA